MNFRLPISFLLFSLLGACADTSCIASLSATSGRGAACIVSPVVETAPVERAVGRTGGTTYTAISAPAAVTAAKTDTIPVRLDASFSASDRAKIVKALDEWNHVLNGFVRLEVSAQAFGTGTQPPFGVIDQRTWFIGRVTGNARNTSRAQFTQGIAQQQTLANGGELMLVFTDRIGKADLGGVMLHEIGHALGLAHEEHDHHLMSSKYASRKQVCIDRNTVRSLATHRGLPFEDLNWCGDAASVNTANVAAAQRTGRDDNRLVAQAR